MENLKIFLLFIIVAILLASCNLPTMASEPAPQPTNSNPPQPSATDTSPPPTETTEPTATIDLYANITHTDMPGSPVLTYYAYDCNTGRYTLVSEAPTIGGGCDLWENNFIEKPINDQMTIYYPYLDIVRFQMGTDGDWVYAEIQMYARENEETVLSGSYGLELDFDVDGQGEVLVMVTNPAQFAADDWVVVGVEVWEDANNDVGGDTLVFADDSHPGDGYETQVFDQGLGEDADLAWARISPDGSNTLEIAFKNSLLQTSGALLWWTWASQERLDPALFDYVDSFSDGEIFHIENSCRWIFSGPPQPVQNICPYEEPKPTREPGDPDDETVAYCWVKNLSPIAVFPQVCMVCPSPCPSGYSCSGTCTP